MQATLANVREMKGFLEELETKDIANFTTALSKAFELLQWVNFPRPFTTVSLKIRILGARGADRRPVQPGDHADHRRSSISVRGSVPRVQLEGPAQNACQTVHIFDWTRGAGRGAHQVGSVRQSRYKRETSKEKSGI